MSYTSAAGRRKTHVQLRRTLRVPLLVPKYRTRSCRVLHAPLFCRLLLDTARGLGHMHAKGKVHRDVKAGNVVVVGGDDESTPLTAKVADFGMTCGEKKIEGTVTPLELHTTSTCRCMFLSLRDYLFQTPRRSYIHHISPGRLCFHKSCIWVYIYCILRYEVLGKNLIIQIRPDKHSRNNLLIQIISGKHYLDRSDLMKSGIYLPRKTYIIQ